MGTVVPGFTLPRLDRGEVALAELLRDGPVALFLFKDGCGATDLAATAVEAIWNGYRDHQSAEQTRLSVLGIGQDPAAITSACARRLGVTFPIAVDERLEVSSCYDFAVTPTLLLLRGEERLRDPRHGSPPGEAFRVLDCVEGWSREAYLLASEAIAARIGAVPVDLPPMAPRDGFRPG